MDRKQLPPHEWLVIVLLITLLGITTIIVTFNGEEGAAPVISAELRPATSQSSGAQGISSSGSESGRSKARGRKRRDGSMVTIYLEGVVQKKGPMRVPFGASFETLPKLVEFAPDADLSQFENNKKKLTEGQVIRVGIKSLS